jgi:hypothetical protein
MHLRQTGLCSVCWVTILCVVGCSKTEPTKPSGTAVEQPHVHGQHEGELFQIGDGQYYVEMVHEGDTVTIYLLDKAHEKYVPTSADSAMIRMVVNATPVEFKLPAKPQADDPQGKTSKFETQEKALDLALDDEKADRELVISIGDKKYTQKFAHFDDEHHHHHEPPAPGAGK